MTSIGVLSARDLSVHRGGDVLLSGVSLNVNAGDRIALVGSNGSGKTSLLRVLVGETAPSAGQVQIAGDLEVSYVPQDVAAAPDRTVRDLITEGLSGLESMRSELEQLHTRIADADPAVELDAVLARYQEVFDLHEARDGWGAPLRLAQAKEALGVNHLDDDVPLARVSGGERVRLQLAVCYSSQAGLVVMDEPTAHLDVAGSDWLVQWIVTTKAGVLVATHDRWLIDAIGARIASIDVARKSIIMFDGSYGQFRRQMKKEQARREQRYLNYESEVQRITASLHRPTRVGHARSMRDRNKLAHNLHGGRVQKAAATRINARREELKRLIAKPVGAPAQMVCFQPRFGSAPDGAGSDRLVEATEFALRVGDRCLVDGLEFSVERRSHLCIAGPNGSGKTTVLKAVASGDSLAYPGLLFAPDLRIGVLTQHVELDQSGTVRDLLEREAIKHDLNTHQAFQQLLHTELVVADDLTRPVSSLSGGEQRLLQLAILSWTPVDLLVLDEPTNYLSFEFAERLEDGLRMFEGGIVSASHDRWFLEHVPTSIIELG
ncbi:MAG: hypothetical protein CSA55_02770 [Ilumatobacter coccineus]|uniref:ABC transporter domain-containing protein n=1 Tax=Ilumatobacter coccineus TaxID=467094 RepID=A0A2G6KB42_9ACTN|nr:MAG: hypothetical protein CSA55_02770 [Ilumatobacter coccineus]